MVILAVPQVNALGTGVATENARRKIANTATRAQSSTAALDIAAQIPTVRAMINASAPAAISTNPAMVLPAMATGQRPAQTSTTSA